MGPRHDAGEATAAGRLVSRTVSLPARPLSSLLRASPRPHVVWSAPDEPAVVARGTAATLTADGAGRVREVAESAAAVFGGADRPADAPAAARPRLFGGFAFHEDHAAAPPWEGFPGAAFVLPRAQFVLDGGDAWLTVNAYGEDADPRSVERTAESVRADVEGASASSVGAPPGVERTERTPDRDTWREQIRAATERIREGDLEKVALAQALVARLGGEVSLPDVLDRLGEAYPDCFRFAFRAAGGGTFFGASPERLVTRRGDRLETGALASTVPRGDDPAADAELERELRTGEKYAHEHDLVVDSIRRQLDAVASGVVTGERAVRKLANVQHLFTPIAADTGRHVLDLVSALHPTPAVGGLPPAEALGTIRETEAFDRGWYAAPVGWFDADGDGTFAVAIRSAVARDRTATLFAGNGIVADSDPDAEWDEVQLKFRPILDRLS